MVADYYGLIKNKISIDTFAFKNNLNFSLDLWKRYFRSNKLINLVFLHYFLLEYIPYPGYLCQVTFSQSFSIFLRLPFSQPFFKVSLPAFITFFHFLRACNNTCSSLLLSVSSSYYIFFLPNFFFPLQEHYWFQRNHDTRKTGNHQCELIKNVASILEINSW